MPVEVRLRGYHRSDTHGRDNNAVRPLVVTQAVD